MKLLKSETQLIGKWIINGKNDVVNDSVTLRIEWLISKYLEKITTDASGWEILFKDPESGFFWELTYPNTEMHGGGAPCLIRISSIEAKKKYNI